jgi:hypothetical protein
VVKKVFAPTARTTKATAITGDTPDALANSVIDTIFAAHPSLQGDLQSALANNTQGASS